jgi:hypothetical protein
MIVPTYVKTHRDKNVSLVFIRICVSPHYRIPLLIRLSFQYFTWNFYITLANKTVFGETTLEEPAGQSRLLAAVVETNYLIEEFHMDSIHAFKEITK